MAELKDRLRADLTTVMKSQDKLRTATLRMLLAAIQTEEVAGEEARELSDAEVIKVLSREATKRGESAEIYTQNGRGELAANEHAEARVIDEYLPTPLTEAEVADVAVTVMSMADEPQRDPETVTAGVMEIVWDTLHERIPAYEGALRLANMYSFLQELSDELISFVALEDDWIEHPDDREEIERDILGFAESTRRRLAR